MLFILIIGVALICFELHHVNNRLWDINQNIGKVISPQLESIEKLLTSRLQEIENNWEDLSK